MNPSQVIVWFIVAAFAVTVIVRYAVMPILEARQQKPRFAGGPPPGTMQPTPVAAAAQAAAVPAPAVGKSRQNMALAILKVVLSVVGILLLVYLGWLTVHAVGKELHEHPLSTGPITWHPIAEWVVAYGVYIFGCIAVLYVIAASFPELKRLKGFVVALFIIFAGIIAIDLMNTYLLPDGNIWRQARSAGETVTANVVPTPLPACNAANVCSLPVTIADSSGLTRQSNRLTVPEGVQGIGDYCVHMTDDTGANPAASGRVQLYTWNHGAYNGLWTHAVDFNQVVVVTTDPSLTSVNYWFVPKTSAGC